MASMDLGADDPLPTVTQKAIVQESTDQLPVYNVNNPARMYIYEGEFDSLLDKQHTIEYKRTAKALQAELKEHASWAQDLKAAADFLKDPDCKGGIVIKQPSAAERSEHRTTTDVPAPNALAGIIFHDAGDVHERSSTCAPAVIYANTDEPPRFLERRSYV
eukprot:TRINITY_DN12676_c2_g1_i14.p3 TRINITY_DN12676_c2_g1~~TRINITY_DN12676_c2_g1_i14.p3  ORF type:complete len:161 (+),score=32.47 TRINITY_DN12676_c2_g1_i14:1470-1952(+)